MSKLLEWYNNQNEDKEEESSVDEQTIIIKTDVADSDEVELRDRASFLKMELILKKFDQIMMNLYNLENPYTEDSQDRMEYKKLLEALHKKLGELIAEL